MKISINERCRRMVLIGRARNIVVALALVLGGMVAFTGEARAATCPAGSLREGEEVELLSECNDETEGDSSTGSDTTGETSAGESGSSSDTSLGESESSGDTSSDESGDTTTTEGSSSEQSGDTEECSSVTLTDEQVASLKELMSQAGYDVSNFKASAVKIAASEIDLCDGMSREEMRSLFNAMGITDLTDEELDANIDDFTKALKKVQENETASEDEAEELEEVLETKSYAAGPAAPNTGISTGDFNGVAIVISLTVVAVATGGVLIVRYIENRRRNFNRVGFKK